MMRLWVICFAVMISLSMLSCASLRQVRTEDAALASLKHRQGSPAACLPACVNMVLDYYGCAIHFAPTSDLKLPANLLVMDSLLHALSASHVDDPYKLHSFVLQEDEAFLCEQLARGRPLILIFRVQPALYHSVVVAGVSADRRHFFVHDPARRHGQWMASAKLLKRWQTSANTLLLIGLAPAGT